MVFLVILFNLILAIACLALAQYLWALRNRLVKLTALLQTAEGQSALLLQDATTALARGEVELGQLRQRYRQQMRRFQQLQTIVSLLGMGWTVWQRQGGKRQGR
ncbi:MAG: hypothetical protein VKK04_09415 [Synechococcales bacterium]|nr:hypothetical protein [Synechococcales bacterium]